MQAYKRQRKLNSLKILSLEAQSRHFFQASIEEIAIGGKPEQFASLAKALRIKEKGSAKSLRRPCEFNSQALRNQFADPAKQFAGLANSFRKACEVDFGTNLAFRKACEISQTLRIITWSCPEDFSFSFCSFLSFFLLSFSQ